MSDTETCSPPPALLEALPPEDHAAVRRWWGSLAPADQRSIRVQWGPRAEQLAWNTPASEQIWRRLPIHLEGRLVHPEEAADRKLMKEQMLSFILNHEIPFFLEERTFHICRQHPPAHAILRNGLLSARFACAVRGVGCPMARLSLAAKGHAIALSARWGRPGSPSSARTPAPYGA